MNNYKEIGVDISTGQIDALLTKNTEDFIAEKNEILRVGLKYSEYINVDDSGARAPGQERLRHLHRQRSMGGNAGILSVVRRKPAENTACRFGSILATA